MKNNLIKLLVLAMAVMSVLFALASCGCSHEAEEIPAVEATCTAAGATAGSKCKLCGEILTEPTVIDIAPHTPANAQKKNPTCTEDGHEAGVKCSVCETAISGMATIPAAHKPVDVAALEPTCTTDGHTAGTRCSVCAEDLTGLEVVAKLPHDLKDVAKIEPKCTEAGSEAGKVCDYGCGYFEGLEAIAPVGHTPVDEPAKAPTCTEDGYEAGKKCSVCGSATEGCAPIFAAGHNVPSWTMEIVPAYNVEGKRTGKCTVCNTDVVEIYAPFTGYTFDAPDATAPSVGASHLTSSLVDRDAGKAFFMTAARTIENAFNGANKINGNWASALTFDRHDNLASFTVSYDVMVPSRDADGDGVSNEYIGDFFANGGNPRFYQALIRTNTKVMAYTYVRMACSTASNPFATSQEDGVVADGWYLTLATTSSNTDEMVVLGEDMQAFALDTWYTITYEIDTVTGSFEIFINGVHAYNVYSAVGNAINVDDGRTTYTSAVEYTAGDQIDVRIGDLARAIGGINFDNVVFAPYTLAHPHTEKHSFAAVDAVPSASCTVAGSAAGVKCTECGLVYSGCETVYADHTRGADSVIVAYPTENTTGKATGTCTVCNQQVDFLLPAIANEAWDYESESDAPRLSDAANVVAPVFKSEGGRTYAEYAYAGEGLKNEWFIFFDADLGKLSTDEIFVFETDIKINSITLTDAYAADLTKTWFMYSGFTDNAEKSVDTDTINNTWYANNADGMKILLNKGNTTEGKAVPYQEWFTLKVTFTLNADDPTKVDLTYSINGNVIYSGTVKDAAAKVADGVVSFKLKFKNKSNFLEQSISLDNSKVYGVYPDAPGANPDVYTYEDAYVPTKEGSGNVDAAVAEVVEESDGNHVFKFGGTSGEAHAFWLFEDMGKLTATNYFKLSTKIKIGNVSGTYTGWICNLGITDEIDDRSDGSRLGFNFQRDENGVYILGTDYYFTTGEWVDLEYYFYYTEEDGKWHQIILVDGVYVGTLNNDLSKKSFDNAVQGIGIKTKNLGNFDSFEIFFDDTSLVEGNLADITLPTDPAPEETPAA